MISIMIVVVVAGSSVHVVVVQLAPLMLLMLALLLQLYELPSLLTGLRTLLLHPFVRTGVIGCSEHFRSRAHCVHYLHVVLLRHLHSTYM